MKISKNEIKNSLKRKSIDGINITKLEKEQVHQDDLSRPENRYIPRTQVNDRDKHRK